MFRTITLLCFTMFYPVKYRLWVQVKGFHQSKSAASGCSQHFLFAKMTTIFLSFLLGCFKAATDICNADALLPLFTDIALWIVGADLKVLETLIAVGIVAEGNNILASTIGHLMQIEASVPHLKLDAAHHVVIRV